MPTASPRLQSRQFGANSDRASRVEIRVRLSESGQWHPCSLDRPARPNRVWCFSRPPEWCDTKNPKVARRLAAILAADIAGYSALMGADEVRTVLDLQGAPRCRPTHDYRPHRPHY